MFLGLISNIRAARRHIEPPAPCAGGGALTGSLSTGIRRSPVRASAPVPLSPPGDRVTGGRLATDSSLFPVAEATTTALPLHVPRQGGRQLAAATGETPSPVAAVSQLAGAS